MLQRATQWAWAGPPPGRETQALVGAATPFRVGRDPIQPRTEAWQSEVWGYYDEQGELWYATEWLAEMVSRVRLLAAEAPAGDGDEPAAIDLDDQPDGEGFIGDDLGRPVVDQGAEVAVRLMSELAGGIGGRAQMLRTLTVHLSVAGECWLVGETLGDGGRLWQVRSADELRSRPGTSGGNGTAPGVEIVDEHHSYGGVVKWRPLAPDSLLVRVWRPHERYRYLADSPAHHAREAMRELSLANRRIAAEYLSRIASAGVWYVPEEVTFPVAPEFADEPDPFVAEFLETARRAIATPGTAAAVVPIPLRVPAELVDKFKHEAFAAAADGQLLDKRKSAIERLATVLDIPAEILTGMGSVNHWTAWQLEESGLKAHISPRVELIAHCLTIGYLWPRLQAEGVERPERFLVWYDASEITVRPDRSQDAVALYDRLELSGEALRRETGFDEADAPDGEELVAAVARRILEEPTLYAEALRLLGHPQPPPPPAPGVGPAVEPGEAGAPGPTPPTEPSPRPRRAPPRTREAPPPPPGEGPGGGGPPGRQRRAARPPAAARAGG
jgi:hypothetical protein